MPHRGVLDTCAVIDLPIIDRGALPNELAIAAVTLAELAAGPHATDDPSERAARQQRLQWAEATFEPLPFDAQAARAYGNVFAAARAAGRTGVRRRFADLLIASVAVAHGLPVVTRNPDDFAGLERVVEILAV